MLLISMIPYEYGYKSNVSVGRIVQCIESGVPCFIQTPKEIGEQGQVFGGLLYITNYAISAGGQYSFNSNSLPTTGGGPDALIDISAP